MAGTSNKGGAVETTPHIGLAHPSNIPADMFKDFEREVRAKNLDLRVEARDWGAFAGVEDWMPTLIMVLIGSHYFSGFLSEAGKSHYTHLESGLKKLWRRLFGAEAPTVHVTSTPGKADPGYEYSRLFSIYAQVTTTQRFKLLLPVRVSQEEFEQSISAYIAFLEAYHAGTLEPELAAMIARARDSGGTKLLAFNRNTRRIEPLYVRDS